MMRIIRATAAILISAYIASAQTPVNLSSDSLRKLLILHPQHDSSRVLLLNQLAFVGYYSNPIASLNSSFEARQIADSIHFTRGEAEAFRQIGLAFWAQADLATAINYYLTGLKIAQTNHHEQVEADIIGNLGTAYNGLGNTKEALAFLNQSLEKQRSLKNQWREAAVLNNIGDVYLNIKQFGRARESYTAALQAAIPMGYKLGVTTNLRNLGNVFEQEGKYDSALANYLKCIKLSAEIQDNRGYVLSHKSIASVYFKTKKFAQANQYAQWALEASKKVNLRAFIRDIYQLMSMISDAERDQSKAFEYFRLYAAYKDSVQNNNIISEIDGQRLRFETEKKQAEIEMLKKEGELQTVRLANKNKQLALILVASFLGITLFIIVVVNYLRSRKIQVKLVAQNLDIETSHRKLSEQNDELVTLNEEIRSQQEELMAQRDVLVEKNTEIEVLYHKMVQLNGDLENQVTKRTLVLKEQNRKMAEYAFLNAHILRAPLARVMGLVNILLKEIPTEKQKVILDHLKVSSQELDDVVRNISTAVQDDAETFSD